MDLSAFTEPERPWTRPAFSDLHRRCRDWIRAQMESAGLEVVIDAGGNMAGKSSGSIDGLPSIACGSHSDTVPSGGRFDGAAGLAAAIEIAHALADNGMRLNHAFEAIDFLAEEPTEFGMSCVGSRAVAGKLTAFSLAAKSPEGTTLAEAIDGMGGDSARLGRPLRGRCDTAAFFELHIEQGTILERAGTDVGIVTEFVCINRHSLKVAGEAAHAGTTPMDVRRDALVGAATLVQNVSERAESLNSRGTYLVATVGRIAIQPNGANVVPGSVELALEIRSNRVEAVRDFEAGFFQFAADACCKAGLKFDAEQKSSAPRVSVNEGLRMHLREAAASSGCSFREMPSGAGHDAAHMSEVCPSCMVFVPCLRGRSHCPEEWSDKDQIGRGAQVMLEAMLSFDALACPK